MTTIYDVAKKAGVAPSTVSRVINHTSYVKDSTRTRVEAAIAELGYVPNTLARGLRSKRTHTLALMVTDITNPFFTMVARGVEDAANAADFTVIYCNTDESLEKEEKYTGILAQKQVDGVLLVPTKSNSDSVNFFQSKGIPVVVMDRSISGVQTDIVRCDSEDGSYQLTQLLIGNGHRQIAIISGPEMVSTARDRVLGYQRAIRESGQALEEMIFYGRFSQESGEHFTRLLMEKEIPPTAILGGNNFITIGILKALKSSGRRVPKDVAVVGFDDLPSSLVTDPFLTVASQPAYDMGRKAADLLLERLAGNGGKAHQHVVLPFELIIRESSGSVLIQP